jgi:hypothetical protein
MSNDLLETINKGLSQEGFRAVARIALESAPTRQRPLLLFVLGHVCLSVADNWEGRPVTFEDAESVRGLLLPGIRHAAAIATASELTESEELQAAHELLRSYFEARPLMRG